MLLVLWLPWLPWLLWLLGLLGLLWLLWLLPLLCVQLLCVQACAKGRSDRLVERRLDRGRHCRRARRRHDGARGRARGR